MRTSATVGWVLYDGDCAFCTRWAEFWTPMLRRRGFAVGALQMDGVPKALGMTQEEAVRDLRLLTNSGTAYAGADVYLFVARRVWWAWPFYALFSRPGFRKLLWAGYRKFAANRYCVSGYCQRRNLL